MGDRFYAKGEFCFNKACDNICLTCDNANSIFNYGKIDEGLRTTCKLDVQNSKSECDRQIFVELNKIKLTAFDWVKEGNNLFLYSDNTGNGKSTWANKIFNYFVFQYATVMALSNKAELHECVVKWANLPLVLDEFRKEYSGQEYDNVLGKHLLESRLVVWDDLGAEVSSKWVLEKLYIYLNERLQRKKSNIITSNLSPEELLQQGKINARIYSRIKIFRKFEFHGIDRRHV